MILRNVSTYGSTATRHIHIAHGKINAIAEAGKELNIPGAINVELDGAIVLPGFINSHDHLDFNLFPPLGNRIYNNYTEWGSDIHLVNSDSIKQVQKVPLSLRIQYGLYKNLLNGFTTVVNHGPPLKTDHELITVFQDCHSLHSPSFEKNWKWKLNNPFSGKKPVVMHMGEGTDKQTAHEIDEVIRWNMLKKKIIAVHGVAMNEQQAGSLEGMVWCPASNYFLLGNTAPVEKLANKIKIVFGTDSTLTSSWNVWEHFRLAIKPGLVTAEQLLTMLTIAPARLWNFPDRGIIREGAAADLTIVKRTDKLFHSGPEDILLVLKKGIPGLYDEKIKGTPSAKLYSRININGASKMIKGDLPALTHSIREYYPDVKFPFSNG